MEKRQGALEIITALFLIIIISCVNATSVRTVTVEPLMQGMLIFNLENGDEFSFSLSISGGANDDIDFWITNPSGNTIVNLGRISQGRSYTFTALESGAYTFYFDNSFSVISSKIVTLSYDISSSALLGIATLIIVVVVLMGIAIGLGVLFYRRKPSQPISA